MPTNGSLNRKLRMALVGGGQGAFIGRVHATAAVLDNRAELVAGALSSDPQRAKASASDYAIAPERAYGSYRELLDKEKGLPADKRIDFVSVATPNNTHFEIAKAAAEAGFNVICDKPMTFDLTQAEQLADAVDRSGVVFALTHNYTGYPLVRQARQMVLGGELGEINAIRASYIQGWLRTRLEDSNQKQAAWRTDPARSGAAGCFGDIATHAYNLSRYMTGLLPQEISCHLKTFEAGRKLDDYGTALVRFENGALGIVTASQITHGRENDVRIEIDGTKGSLEWHQEEPNKMTLRRNGQPHAIYTRDPNAPFMSDPGRAACRLPSGHPEGFFEAFANVYRSAYDAMTARAANQKFEAVDTIYPNVNDGVEGMYFIQQSVASSAENGAWLPLKHKRARRVREIVGWALPTSKPRCDSWWALPTLRDCGAHPKRLGLCLKKHKPESLAKRRDVNFGARPSLARLACICLLKTVGWALPTNKPRCDSWWALPTLRDCGAHPKRLGLCLEKHKSEALAKRRDVNFGARFSLARLACICLLKTVGWALPTNKPRCDSWWALPTLRDCGAHPKRLGLCLEKHKSEALAKRRDVNFGARFSLARQACICLLETVGWALPTNKPRCDSWWALPTLRDCGAHPKRLGLCLEKHKSEALAKRRDVNFGARFSLARQACICLLETVGWALPTSKPRCDSWWALPTLRDAGVVGRFDVDRHVEDREFRIQQGLLHVVGDFVAAPDR